LINSCNTKFPNLPGWDAFAGRDLLSKPNTQITYHDHDVFATLISIPASSRAAAAASNLPMFSVISGLVRPAMSFKMVTGAASANTRPRGSPDPLNVSATRLKDWCDASFALVYPTVCQLCGEERAAPKEGLVCQRCWSKVRFIKPPFCERCGLPYQGEVTTSFECTNCRELEFHFSSARSAVTAGGVILEAIHRYKYSQAMWFEPFLADVFLREAAPALHGQSWNLIVPVPLHPTKRREREFNQAERMASHLSRTTRIPLKTKLLRRVVPTRTQTLLTRQQRSANVRGAFAFRNGQRLEGERVILVDDVFTTGATTDACARVLRAHGAGEVCVWTVARGL